MGCEDIQPTEEEADVDAIVARGCKGTPPPSPQCLLGIVILLCRKKLSAEERCESCSATVSISGLRRFTPSLLVGNGRTTPDAAVAVLGDAASSQSMP